MPFTLKAARVQSNLTQVEIAERLGISHTTYRRYEKNPRCMPSGCLARFARIVQVPINQIKLEGKEESNE